MLPMFLSFSVVDVDLQMNQVTLQMRASLLDLEYRFLAGPPLNAGPEKKKIALEPKPSLGNPARRFFLI
jgi:hypothetical protein